MNPEVTALILEKLSEFLNRPVDVEELNGSYADLGADSMDMVVLAFELELYLGHEVAPELFLEYESLRGALESVFDTQEPVDR